MDDQLLWKTVLDSPCLGKVDPWRLDECAECELCGGCAVHECQQDDASVLLHLDWFKDFANPGDLECGSVGQPSSQTRYEPRPCNLPIGHGGKKHRARMGWSWTATRDVSRP